MKAQAEPFFVSIIIPCYNQAHFLSDAIESVLAQSYRSREVIIVDDGSTDNTSGICRRYSTVYLRQHNQGLAAARNAGYRASSGNYLVFLDADDCLTPSALEAHLLCFSKNPELGFVTGDIDHISLDGSHLGSPRWPLLAGNQYRELLRGNHVGNTIAVMFRREVIQEVGGFKSAFDAVADYELLLSAARRYPSAHHRNVVAQYRRHSASMSCQGDAMLRAMYDVMQLQLPLLDTAELRAAWRQGDAYWRDHFGAATIKQMVSQIRNVQLGAATRATVSLLRYVRGRLLLLPWKRRKRILSIFRSSRLNQPERAIR